jgi:catechol 2,3-dioxygenase-like lactoylglutathione lyase family enzyme
MIIGIDHIQITVPASAVAEARTFYCGLLGLREVEKPAVLQDRGGFWLQVGDREVHVGAEEGVDRHLTKAHVAYAVSDLAGGRARLAAAGVEVLDGIPIPGSARLEFRDPFGNRVELIESAGDPRRGPVRRLEGSQMPDPAFREAIAAFVGVFEEVFERDWEYARTMLSAANTAALIAPGATFLNPGVEDEAEDWGARAELLGRYRQLLQVLERHGVRPKRPW